MNKSQQNPVSILVVDDNPDNIYLVRFLLEREGYSVIEASNATDAIQLVKDNSISLILMDISMPGMDGLEATRIIKGFAPEITIVALTARLMLQDKSEIETAGCDGIIEKPIVEPARLHQQIKAYLKK
jgi:two-component system, cell cycle response regulator DivK